MTVVVFGASGKVGRLVVPALVDAGSTVRAVVRRDDAAAEAAAAGAQPVLFDLEDASAAASAVVAGADAVVWVAGANIATGNDHSDRVDRDANLRLIEAAVTAGVPRWIQTSSLYADRIDQAPPVLAHFLGNKVQADDALRATSIDWTVVRPAGISDAEGTGRVTVMAEGMGYGMIPRVDVAATLAALVTGGLAARRSFDLAGGDTAIADALATL
jgi:uncharacterized protein YbjT (DUF2867 family)